MKRYKDVIDLYLHTSTHTYSYKIYVYILELCDSGHRGWQVKEEMRIE